MTRTGKFLRFLEETNVLQKGEFLLKDGSKSNKFFNFGNIKNGRDLIELGKFYSDYIYLKKIYEKIDFIFGPSYKGIPLVVSTSCALSFCFGIDVPICYNRKEEKDHGEKGNFIGYDFTKEPCTCLVLDDVFTSGKTKYEVLDMFSKYPNVKILGFLVGVNRSKENDFLEKTGIPILYLASL